MEEISFYIFLFFIGIIFYLTYPKDGSLKIFSIEKFLPNTLFFLTLFFAGFSLYLRNIGYLVNERLNTAITVSGIIAFILILNSLKLSYSGSYKKNYHSLQHNSVSKTALFITIIVLIFFIMIAIFFYKEILLNFYTQLT